MSANNLSEIRKLLLKYYDGLTTEAEEMTLREYFTSGDDIPADMEADRLMFSKLPASTDPDIPFDLDERLNAKIDEWDAAERQAAETRKRIRLPYPGIIGIAASMLVLLSIGFYLMRPEQQHAVPPSEPTPMEAYAQTEKALRIFANAVDKSMEQMETVEETSTKVNRQIDRQLKQLANI